MNQLLDQKLRLIEGIAAKKGKTTASPHSGLVGSLLPDHRQAAGNVRLEEVVFEIYRGSQRDVLIITFDELLAKLKALHEILSTKPDEPEEDLSDQFADLL